MPAFCGIICPKECDVSLPLEKMKAALAHRGGNPVTFEKEGLHFCQIGRPLDSNEKALTLTDGDPLPTFGEEDFWNKLPTAFAFARFDRESKTLLLARDHFGIKPLYFAQKGDLFIFASELKALILSGLLTLHPDSEALTSYLSLGYIPLDKTPILEVRRLRPGHALTLNSDGDLSIRGYFSYSDQLNHKDHEWNWDHFNQIAPKELSPNPPNAPFDIEKLPQLVWYLDEPKGSIEAFHFFEACQNMTSPFISSIGSPNHLIDAIGVPRLSAKPLRRLYRALLHFCLLCKPMHVFKSPAYYATLRQLATHKWHTRYLLSQFNLDPRQIRRLTGNHFAPLDPELLFHSFPPFERMGANYSSLLYLYHKTLLSSELLPIQERLTSAHGLELQTPFLAPEISSAFASMPETLLKRTFKKPLTPRYKQPLDLAKFQKIFALLKKGVLVDNGIIEREMLKHLSYRGHYQLLNLELWFRLFYEEPQMLPSQTTTEMLQNV